MTSPYLVGDIEKAESLRLDAYQDTKGIWTIGWGHTGRDVHEGLVWDKVMADRMLGMDISDVIHGLDTSMPWWRTLDDIRQDVMVNIAFNMGIDGFLKCKTFLSFASQHKFAEAALDMHGFAAFQENRRRYVPLSKQFASGKHVPIEG